MTVEIGKLIRDPQEKDAIHIAVAPVVAACKIAPGENIGFITNDNSTVAGYATKHIGIADPYLKEIIQKGQKFWMFLYPNTIISLRHDWVHPSFDMYGYEMSKAKEWITNWAKTYGMSYDQAMQAGREKDFFLGEVCYDNIPYEFWTHFELITGMKVDDDTKEHTHFHCAC